MERNYINKYFFRYFLNVFKSLFLNIMNKVFLHILNCTIHENDFILWFILIIKQPLNLPLKQQIFGKCVELNVQAIELLDASPLIGTQIEDCSS